MIFMNDGNAYPYLKKWVKGRPLEYFNGNYYLLASCAYQYGY